MKVSFMGITVKGGKCEACGRVLEKGTNGALVSCEDSLELVCFSCGEFLEMCVYAGLSLLKKYSPKTKKYQEVGEQ